MKKSYILFSLIACVQVASAQYWQQRVDYVMDVQLNEKEKTIDGFEKLTYTNHSPDTLHFIWFHLWPNAYKNDRTAFSEQLLQNGNTSFYFANNEQRGYINRLAFKVDGQTARTEDHPQHIDITRLILPEPLAPGGKVTITTPFHVKLPFNFSRGGYDGSSFQVTQWYPKPAVYDARGWHEMPYLDQGEFYSEFGSYDVHITVPRSFVVAATGRLQDQEEWDWMLHKPEWQPEKTMVNKNAAGKKNVGSAEEIAIEQTKTLHFLQDSIHDFAWFADQRFTVQKDTCVLPSGKIIEVASYYTPAEKKIWQNSLVYAKDALRFYSDEVGEYPYSIASVVQGPPSFGGGMEYPTITIISPTEPAEELDAVIAHELGHNWFYGILASNERMYPWMDEGINSYYEYKYRQYKYGRQEQLYEVLFQTKARMKTDQPVNTAAPEFSESNYYLVVYHKTAMWLQYLEQQLGREKMKRMMQDYYHQWQFRHPQPDDLKNLFLHYGGSQLSWTLQDSTGILPGKAFQGFRVTTPLKKNFYSNYLTSPSRNLLFISPAFGVNKYDKLMLGGLFTNYKLPPNRFQFLFLPLYATHSKKFNQVSSIKLTLVPAGRVHRIEVGMGALNFSKNEALDSNHHHLYERFRKLTPFAKIYFHQPARSSRAQWIEARSYFINETDFNRFAISSIDSLLYAGGTKGSHYYVNQLRYGFADYRKLYPYDYELKLQQGKGFYRVDLDAHFYFNYADGGGLKLRFFGSKFGVTGNTSPFSVSRFQPKLLGVNGEEDYTYSNFFIGRTASYSNSSEAPVKNGGFSAQQIMIRDGGLKMRLDAFDFLQGRSENWVGAINLSTSLPKNFLPVPIPLRIFMDAGTWSEAWDRENEGERFLYVAGLELSLFKDLLHVYAPVIYSRIIKDNLKTLPEQNSFMKRLTFSIDIQNFNFEKLSGKQLF